MPKVLGPYQILLSHFHVHYFLPASFNFRVIGLEIFLSYFPSIGQLIWQFTLFNDLIKKNLWLNSQLVFEFSLCGKKCQCRKSKQEKSVKRKKVQKRNYLCYVLIHTYTSNTLESSFFDKKKLFSLIFKPNIGMSSKMRY